MLPDKLIRISDSPSNGMIRAIDLRRVLIYNDLKQIKLTTLRRFFEHDANEADGVGEEKKGNEFLPWEHDLVASEDKLVNPANGLMVYADTVDDVTTYADALGTVVAKPIGMYTFFSEYLTQAVSVWALAVATVQQEDAVYHTWNK